MDFSEYLTADALEVFIRDQLDELPLSISNATLMLQTLHINAKECQWYIIEQTTRKMTCSVIAPVHPIHSVDIVTQFFNYFVFRHEYLIDFTYLNGELDSVDVEYVVFEF